MKRNQEFSTEKSLKIDTKSFVTEKIYFDILSFTGASYITLSIIFSMQLIYLFQLTDVIDFRLSGTVVVSIFPGPFVGLTPSVKLSYLWFPQSIYSLLQSIDTLHSDIHTNTLTGPQLKGENLCEKINMKIYLKIMQKKTIKLS